MHFNITFVALHNEASDWVSFSPDSRADKAAICLYLQPGLAIIAPNFVCVVSPLVHRELCPRIIIERILSITAYSGLLHIVLVGTLLPSSWAIMDAADPVSFTRVFKALITSA